VELLKQIGPGVTSAAILWDPAIIAGIGQFAVIQSVAPSLNVDVRPISVRDAVEIERAVAAFATNSRTPLSNFCNSGSLCLSNSNLFAAVRESASGL
jgi:putative tryptophan/tyrosine transport system substrate-binding protein